MPTASSRKAPVPIASLQPTNRPTTSMPSLINSSKKLAKVSYKLMARSITIEDLYKFQLLSRPRISPDGQRVAFVVTTIDERRHAYQSAIWVIPTAGGEAKRFTGGPAKA